LCAIALAAGISGSVVIVAAVLALAGVWGFEALWVKAGQSVPLS
jgi:hypothetical protein